MAGTGCLLVRREVFEELEPAWYVAREDGGGSDYNATLRMRDGGFRIALDPRVHVGHVACYAGDLGDAMWVERQERARREQGHGAGVVGGAP